MTTYSSTWYTTSGNTRYSTGATYINGTSTTYSNGSSSVAPLGTNHGASIYTTVTGGSSAGAPVTASGVTYSSAGTRYVDEPGVTYTVISDNTLGATSRVVSEPALATTRVAYPSSTVHYTTTAATTDISRWYKSVDNKVQRHDVQAFYRRRLERLFQKYAQSRLPEVSNLLLEHRDKEPTLLFDLVKQYGEEPAENEVLQEIKSSTEKEPFVKPHPGDDMNGYVNGEWEASTTIPDNQFAWGSFLILREDNLERCRAILEAPEQKDSLIGMLYDKALNLPSKGVPTSVATALKSISDEVTDGGAQSFFKLAGSSMLTRYGRSVLFHVCKSEDSKNPEIRVPHIMQRSLGLPDMSFYTDREDVHEDYKAYITTISGLFGYADVDASKIFEFEKQIAAHHYTMTERRDPDNTYNKRDFSDDVAAKLPDFFGALPDVDPAQLSYVIIENPKLLDFLVDFIPTVETQTLRDYLIFMVADHFAPLANEETLNAHFEFRVKKLSGQSERDPEWKRALKQVEAHLGDELGKIYVKKHFPADAKQTCNNMIDDLKASLKETLKGLAWMADSTKEEALRKLEGFGVKIGVPEEWHTIAGLWGKDEAAAADALKGMDLSEAHMAWTLWDWQTQEVAKFYTPPERKLWHMTPQTVNAYYHPQMNEIVFPAGILQKPFFGHEHYEQNLGAIGVVIGHEMTHGFDDQGRKYNAKGEMKDWWGDNDAVEFDSRAQVVVDHFAKQTVLGKPVNGKLTLGENIADIGGLKLALRAATTRLGDLTQAQREHFFTAYAEIWRMKMRDAMALQRLATDPHSPTQLRINAALGHIPEWYETYNVSKEHTLYLPEKERMNIW